MLQLTPLLPWIGRLRIISCWKGPSLNTPLPAPAAWRSVCSQLRTALSPVPAALHCEGGAGRPWAAGAGAGHTQAAPGADRLYSRLSPKHEHKCEFLSPLHRVGTAVKLSATRSLNLLSVQQSQQGKRAVRTRSRLPAATISCVPSGLNARS